MSRNWQPPTARTIAPGTTSRLRALEHPQPDPHEEDREQQERERAGGDRQHGQHAEMPALAGLEGPEREQPEREPERERERRRDHEPGPDDRERPARPARDRPVLPADHDRERERRDPDREDGQRPDPEHGRQRVVEDAVRDEAVAPAVPEVVPELEPVVEEDRPLVDVGSQVVPGGAQPDEQCCERGGRAGCEHCFAQKEVRALHVARRLAGFQVDRRSRLGP